MSTRQEIYDAVWRKPLAHVAIDLGVSDTQLRKACVRAEIPVPGRGYWAQMVGNFKAPKPPPLPGTGSRPVTIVVHPARARNSMPVASRASQTTPKSAKRTISADDEAAEDSRPSALTACRASEMFTTNVSVGARPADAASEERTPGSPGRGGAASEADHGGVHSGATSPLNWHVLESACLSAILRAHMLDFMAQLEAAASLLPQERRSTARAALRPLYLELQCRDPVAGLLDAIVDAT